MLLIGPPGSGKTSRILDALERAIRIGRSREVQLLVPTASMKRHLVNLMARRGLMVPVRTISTMSEFVRDLTPQDRQAHTAAEDRLLRGAIRRTARRAFGAQSGSRGLRNRLAALISEFWAAGTDSYSVEPAARNRRQRAFVTVFREYEDSLARLGYVHHNQRIARAAARVRSEGLGSVREVYLDGFDRFTRQQEELLESLAEQAEGIVVALPADLPRYPLQKLRHTLLPPRPDSAVRTDLARAANPRAEVLEIARQILESERPLREHAIILRSPERYDSSIREVFETLGIPHLFWQRPRLADHGVARHFLRWLRAIEQRFPGEETLEAMTSSLTPDEYGEGMDAFDFAVRERLPGDGLAFFRDAASEYPDQQQLLRRLGHCERWHLHRRGSSRWGRECLNLLGAILELRPPTGPGNFQRTRDWREAVAARMALVSAIEDTAELPEFSGRRVDFGSFLEALEDVLRATELSVPDQRYDVVHVLPILEARQWSIPVVFVCGLAEGWFPRHHPQDFLFDDEERAQLQGRGVAIRSAADRAAEERFLYQVATSRATDRLVLTYPLADDLGKPLVRSGLLAGRGDPRQTEWARLGDSGATVLAPAPGALPADLRATLAERNRRFSVSGIQSFRQCPYLYFSDNTLGLRGRPARPDDRLDGAVLGTIVHDVLELWNRQRSDIGELLDRTFRKKMEQLHIGESFRTERLRLALRADLSRFAGEQGASMGLPEGSQAYFEQNKSYRIEGLEPQPEVRCRIDRFDVDAGRRCVVTDYKYARPDRVRALLREHLAGEQLQLMIYLAALEQDLGFEPSGMALCGLRGETSYEGVAVDGSGGLRPLERGDLLTLLNTAREEAAAAVRDVLHGAIAVLPKDTRYCDTVCAFRSVCRVRWGSREEAGG